MRSAGEGNTQQRRTFAFPKSSLTGWLFLPFEVITSAVVNVRSADDEVPFARADSGCSAALRKSSSTQIFRGKLTVKADWPPSLKGHNLLSGIWSFP
ncbi:hypothetical protein WJX79_008544 [Trebouxia sp. C0005]